jgi:hypothetical protein
MPERAGPVFHATIDAFLRGVEFGGEGTVELVGEALGVTVGKRRALVAFSRLDGLREGSGSLELFADTGDTLAMFASSGLDVLARTILNSAHALPELTRSLRGLGSHRARPDDDHDRFFAPFISARAKAERTSEALVRLEAFDASRLREAVERQVLDFARTRYPDQPPDRRATEAILGECTDDVVRRLERLAAAAAAVRASPPEVQLARWRAWRDAVHDVIDSADRCWFAMHPVLHENIPPPKRRWWRRLRFGAALSMLVPATAAAQHVTLRVEGVSTDTLIARGFDVVFEGRDHALVVIEASRRGQLDLLGARVSPVVAPGTSRERQLGLSAVTVTQVYRSYDDSLRGIGVLLDSLARTNPQIHLDTIGQTLEGRPILAVKIGEREDAPSRPNVLFMATYHAREWAATEMALRLIRHLSTSPAPSPRVDSLVRRRDIWIVPVVNPDGYQYTFTTDRLWRKNRRPNTDGTYGVDLNRNHTEHWGADEVGSSSLAWAETYRGPFAESEVETQAIAAFHRAHVPVVSVSYHTFTGLILWPWGDNFGRITGDDGIFRALGGTDVRPAVRDNLPGSERDHYHPAWGWNLYPTNGEYTDWAYATFGTIAFTPELTSGFENNGYYGFEFPDNESRLAQMFEDNLPFALDLLDAASNPMEARSITTGLENETIGIESLSPIVRVRVPRAQATRTTVQTRGVVPVHQSEDAGAYMVRMESDTVARPARATIIAGEAALTLTVLSSTGAEANETGWVPNGFTVATERVSGRSAWHGTVGRLRSPLIHVPANIDTVSVLFWTRYLGNGFSMDPRGEVRLSVDSGASWVTVGLVSGRGPVWYPERVVMTGLAGRAIVIEFVSQFFSAQSGWWLDEILVTAHGAATVVQADGELRPSTNPVRSNVVHLTWPFADGSGDIRVFDFAGRLVWATPVQGGATTVIWDIASVIRNGVYVAVARSEGRIRRLKLFIARRPA